MKTKSASIPKKAKSSLSAEKRLHKTCDQMEMLQSRISVLRARHQRACSHKSRCLAVAESLHLQLSVLEGVYAMYYSYAETQSEQLLHCEH